MSFATFADLKANVRSAFNDRSDIPDFIYTLTTAELNSRLRLRIMESTSTLSVSGESTALPSDFLEARHLYLDTTPRAVIDLADEFSKNAAYRSSGQPREATIAGSNLIVNPAPDGTYSVELRYVAKLDDFTLDADTNTVLTTYPALYFFCALKHAAAWEQDQEAASGYMTMLEQEIDRVHKQDMTARYGGGPLRVRASAVA